MSVPPLLYLWGGCTCYSRLPYSRCRWGHLHHHGSDYKPACVYEQHTWHWFWRAGSLRLVDFSRHFSFVGTEYHIPIPSSIFLMLSNPSPFPPPSSPPPPPPLLLLPPPFLLLPSSSSPLLLLHSSSPPPQTSGIIVLITVSASCLYCCSFIGAFCGGLPRAVTYASAVGLILALLGYSVFLAWVGVGTYMAAMVTNSARCVSYIFYLVFFYFYLLALVVCGVMSVVWKVHDIRVKGSKGGTSSSDKKLLVPVV